MRCRKVQQEMENINRTQKMACRRWQAEKDSKRWKMMRADTSAIEVQVAVASTHFSVGPVVGRLLQSFPDRAIPNMAQQAQFGIRTSVTWQRIILVTPGYFEQQYFHVAANRPWTDFRKQHKWRTEEPLPGPRGTEQASVLRVGKPFVPELANILC